MKKPVSILLILLGISLSVVGCAVLGTESAVLADTSWKLIQYDSTKPLPGSGITLEFKDGQVSGNAGCNHYFGTYQTQGSSISISDLAWTEMACLDPEGIMSQEQEVMSLLSSASRYELGNATLTLITAGGEQLKYNQINE